MINFNCNNCGNNFVVNETLTRIQCPNCGKIYTKNATRPIDTGYNVNSGDFNQEYTSMMMHIKKKLAKNRKSSGICWTVIGSIFTLFGLFCLIEKVYIGAVMYLIIGIIQLTIGIRRIIQSTKFTYTSGYDLYNYNRLCNGSLVKIVLLGLFIGGVFAIVFDTIDASYFEGNREVLLNEKGIRYVM
jgi:predicted RNA-binding Zn-ribbon protein involved in translation (DUF1610 family)